MWGVQSIKYPCASKVSGGILSAEIVVAVKTKCFKTMCVVSKMTGVADFSTKICESGW